MQNLTGCSRQHSLIQSENAESGAHTAVHCVSIQSFISLDSELQTAQALHIYITEH